MKVCILGNGLISLTVAKALVNQGIYVDIFSNQKKMMLNKVSTLGISKSNIEFFNDNILNIEKFLWNINRIEIFSENLENKKILNFENDNKRLFSIIKSYELYDFLYSHLTKNKFFSFKNKINNNDYKLLINCDFNNKITKKFFFKKFRKNYKSYAHTAIIEHAKLKKNCVASQIFTKEGPMAFLPMSDKKTSIVYSMKGKKKVNLESLIKKYNTKYEINRIGSTYSFELKSSALRTYYHKNILAFGDLLHKLHPLAGQGYNMSIRDIKELLKLIKYKINHGLDLDISICSDFEKKTRNKNFLFLNGIDFIYQFFNLESKVETNILSKSVKLLNRNKYFKKLFTEFADNGIVF